MPRKVFHKGRARQVLHEQTEAMLALFQFRLGLSPRPSLVCFGDGPPDRRHQPRAVVLQNVIGGALLEGFDGTFFADGAGDEYERCIRAVLLDRFQGGHATEAGQRVIGQDYVRPKCFQCVL